MATVTTSGRMDKTSKPGFRIRVSPKEYDRVLAQLVRLGRESLKTLEAIEKDLIRRGRQDLVEKIRERKGSPK